VRGANAVAEAMGYGKGFHALDDDTIRRFVNTRWASGKSYSEAIWGDSERVAAWVQDDMAKALARGESWRRLCDELSRRFVGVSERDVMRLVVTEGTYVSRQAQLAKLVRGVRGVPRGARGRREDLRGLLGARRQGLPYRRREGGRDAAADTPEVPLPDSARRGRLGRVDT